MPVRVPRADELPSAISSATELADIIEVRVDYLRDEEREAVMPLLREQARQSLKPIIITFRAAEQGGHSDADFETRHRFWTSLTDISGRVFFDLEFDQVQSFAREEASGESKTDWSRVICSHHDFAGIPSDLDQIYDRMAATPAGILKVAVHASDATDCLSVFRLLEHAQREGREMIAIAMGQSGIVTRILGPSRGSFLTYGSFDDQNATAPGQLSARNLRKLYRFDKINQQTEIVGLIGNPLAHSLSPYLHNSAFEAAGRNAVYIPFEVHDPGQFMRRMAQPSAREIDWNLRGFSVTAPHKSALLDSLDWIDPVAREIGAVNTVVVTQNELHGHNTDVEGFIAPLISKFGSLKGARCAIIGAGGGARAAVWAMRREGAQPALFARDPNKSRLMSEEFGIDLQSISEALFAGFDIVVNATPLGTRGVREAETPATAAQFRGVRLAYDLVYNPLETSFLREARAAGCDTLGGIEMLLAQAVEQYKLWFRNEPDVEVMRAAAFGALS